MYDIGKTDPETLYDFAISLSCTTWTCLDPQSELYKAMKEVFDSAWGQLPEIILLDFRPDIPTPKPPVTLVWSETAERYFEKNSIEAKHAALPEEPPKCKIWDEDTQRWL